MKGLITLIFCLLALSFEVSAGIKARDLSGIKLQSGEIIGNLSLQESTKVLKSLDQERNIEIRSRVIYPEEVTQLIVSKLTNARLTGKKPNPQDYN
ncbi:MAG: hypothetical protein Q7U04_06665 [Bacteriovorax sp.]|nr:hypothetical protein [Bacteriovorax sp.]